MKKTKSTKVLAIGLAGSIASVGTLAGITVAASQPRTQHSLSAIDNARFSNVGAVANAQSNGTTTDPDQDFLDREYSDEIYKEQKGNFDFFIKWRRNSLDRTATKVVPSGFYGRWMTYHFWLPSQITEIGSGAFEWAHFTNFPNETEGFSDGYFTLPPNVTKIGIQAFQYCGLPWSFQIPKSLKVIDQQAFEGTNFGTGFTLPSTVETISWSAFKSAGLPVGFTVPNEVKWIAPDAFDGAGIPSGTTWTKDGLKTDKVGEAGHTYKI